MNRLLLVAGLLLSATGCTLSVGTIRGCVVAVATDFRGVSHVSIRVSDGQVAHVPHSGQLQWVIPLNHEMELAYRDGVSAFDNAILSVKDLGKCGSKP